MKLEDKNLAQKILNDYICGKTYKQIESEYGISAYILGKLINGEIFEDCIKPKNIKEIARRRTRYGNGVSIDAIYFTQEQIEIVDGSLLGEGMIRKKGYFIKKQGEAEKRKKYIDWHYEK